MHAALLFNQLIFNRLNKMHLLGGDCMSDKKEKFLTRNYILMLLLNCIYGVSQNFITTPLAK